MPILLTDDATDRCVRCGGTDKTSIIEIRPHHVWCCVSCYCTVLAGSVYIGPVLATSLFGDIAAAPREHGSATVVDHRYYFRRRRLGGGTLVP